MKLTGEAWDTWLDLVHRISALTMRTELEPISIREMRDNDLPSPVRLYHEPDSPGDAGQHGTKEASEDAHKVFARIKADEHQRTFLACSGDSVVGTFVLLIVPNLAHGCLPWAVVENVVVDPRYRGVGVGRAMMEFARARALESGCYKIVLSSNVARKEAHRFYEHLGWRKSHFGYSLELR